MAENETWEQELPLIGITKAAKEIGITAPTMRKMVDLGQVKVVKVGDRRMIPQSELKRLVESAAPTAKIELNGEGELGT